MNPSPLPVIIPPYTPILVVYEAKESAPRHRPFGEQFPENQRSRVIAALIGGQTIVKRIGMDHHTLRQ
jgi:hypothetical protein